jgi:hypothetical protein
MRLDRRRDVAAILVAGAIIGLLAFLGAVVQP